MVPRADQRLKPLSQTSIFLGQRIPWISLCAGTHARQAWLDLEGHCSGALSGQKHSWNLIFIRTISIWVAWRIKELTVRNTRQLCWAPVHSLSHFTLMMSGGIITPFPVGIIIPTFQTWTLKPREAESPMVTQTHAADLEPTLCSVLLPPYLLCCIHGTHRGNVHLHLPGVL